MHVENRSSAPAWLSLDTLNQLSSPSLVPLMIEDAAVCRPIPTQATSLGKADAQQV